jgi:DNA-binding GntR family transcriptional regulator
MPSASDQAYDAIRRNILTGKLQVGERLGEVALGQQLGMSRTPIREALRRLNADGLVELRANRAALVAPSIDRELSEAYAVRAHLEGLGASLAAERIDEPALMRLRELCSEMEEAYRGKDDAYALLNIEFHNGIAASSGSARLRRLVATLTEASLVSTAYSRLAEHHIVRSLSHHRELVTALEYRDGEWAGSLMRTHIFAARAVIVRRQRNADSA